MEYHVYKNVGNNLVCVGITLNQATSEWTAKKLNKEGFDVVVFRCLNGETLGKMYFNCEV